jgi:hypothetical protein
MPNRPGCAYLSCLGWVTAPVCLTYMGLAKDLSRPLLNTFSINSVGRDVGHGGVSSTTSTLRSCEPCQVPCHVVCVATSTSHCTLGTSAEHPYHNSELAATAANTGRIIYSNAACPALFAKGQLIARVSARGLSLNPLLPKCDTHCARQTRRSAMRPPAGSRADAPQALPQPSTFAAHATYCAAANMPGRHTPCTLGDARTRSKPSRRTTGCTCRGLTRSPVRRPAALRRNTAKRSTSPADWFFTPTDRTLPLPARAGLCLSPTPCYPAGAEGAERRAGAHGTPPSATGGAPGWCASR